MESIKAVIKSFSFAFQGILSLFLRERNAKIHLIMAMAVIALGLWLEVSTTDWVLLTLTIGFVLFAEGVNTAIEKIVDLVSPEEHPIAGQAKDLAAGAVLISAISAAIVGLIIFLPKFLS